MPETLVIGAQNIDIFAHAESDLNMHDSNRSMIGSAFGGVACNIVTNLALLGNDVSFLTVFGDDAYSSSAKKNLADLTINFEESLNLKNQNNSIYLAVMDKHNDLFIGMNDMAIIEQLNIDFFKTKKEFIESFDILVIDNNLTVDSLVYLFKTYQNKKIITDTVSAEKAVKLKNVLKYISLLKVNIRELNALSDKETTDQQTDDLLNRGLSKIIVTNTDKEIFFKSNKEHIKTMPIEAKKIINSSGAGDAFLAGFIHGIIHNMSTENCLETAKKIAYLTLQSSSSTNRNITISDI